MAMADTMFPINICNYEKLKLSASSPNKEEGKMSDKVLIFGKDA
jgi:hypothetical protein